ncbi:MAG: hypothetical protein EOO13_03310 [Chitinophagaceae bacterium]|nr:MAG: hypothetical protein EOO13_03310 [Chitinophagaceae bacterium]
MKKFLILLLLAFTAAPLFSQNLFDSLLNELNTKYPQEKTYIHLDKSFYNPGETVWFKAYIRPENPGTQISTTYYAELMNEKGNVLERKTMPVLLSGAASNFIIPDTVKSSKIYIRAYTTWMLNFDSTLLYTKAVNILRPESVTKKENVPVYSLSFFPEGGDMVVGIESKVAFKATDQEGKPFAVKGTIVNETGKEVASFNSVHNGMGYTLLSPAFGIKYKAIWKDPTGKQQETMLRAARSDAATLAVMKLNGQLNYSIKRPETATDDMKEFVVIAQMQQQTVYAARINLKNKTMATAPIPLDSLPDGVMQITLFNRASLPLAERIVYNKGNNQYFITDLHIIEKNLKQKGRNVIQVDVGGNLRSNLSISITDADLDIKPTAQENIYSQFFLSSDLKGTIYNPAYYFSNDEDSVSNHLDLVMMTNGWRRFNWEKVLAGNMPVIKHIPDNFLSVKGNVFGLTPMQLTDKMITGIVHTSNKAETSIFTVPVNKDGSFKIDQMYFFDTIKISYQINGDKNKRLTDMASFSFKNNFVPSPIVDKGLAAAISYAPQPPKALALKSIQQNDAYKELLASQKIKVLETVSVSARAKTAEEKLDAEYASSMFTSGNSKIFNIADDPFANSATTVLDYLRGRVAGLQISTSGAEEGSITRRGSTTEVFLNEMPADIALIQSTPMSNVAMIKVFDPPFFGSFGGGAGGAVAVYTKKGAAARADIKGLSLANIQGYSSLKEFYSPDYTTEPVSTPDFRTTLYWNPFLLMNAQNKRVTIPFFNNDSGRRLRVVIEGINELGQLSREEKIFE